MRIINCKITKNIKNLQSLLNVRRDGRNINTSIVPRILKNIKSTKKILQLEGTRESLVIIIK